MDIPKIYMVVAADEKNGIGKNGKLPWHFKKELKYFSELTKTTSSPDKENIVVMGRTTWENIPSNFRPLPGRRNIVLTKKQDYQAEGAEIANSLDQALAIADSQTENIFIIGGGKVFEEFMRHHKLNGLYLTKIHNHYDCDTYLQNIPSHFKARQLGQDSENGVNFEYFLYT